jgi:hypothetical protein
MKNRLSWLVAGAVVALGAFGSIRAGSNTYSIDAHVISAGTSSLSGSPCFRMWATIAEPVAGYSSSTNYSFSAGFRAVTQSAGSDDIFFSGFEVCPP